MVGRCLPCLVVATLVAAAPPPSFDGGRAYEHIRQLVAIGPRPPGSAGIDAARRYITQQLQTAGVAVTTQPFDAETPIGRIRMVNLMARIPGRSADRILVGGHYDTKLFREFRFVGANDAGSSTAFLIELARVLKARSNPFTFELVFFDGEEALRPEWGPGDHTYGSQHFVTAARAAGTLASIRALLLVDMIGDRDLRIMRDSNSTGWLTDLVWTAASRLGHDDIFVDEETTIEDDHLPFVEAGVPAVDIIDLEFPAWHTAGDTLDTVSARSLQIVGNVVVEALPAIEARLAAGRDDRR